MCYPTNQSILKYSYRDCISETRKQVPMPTGPPRKEHHHASSEVSVFSTLSPIIWCRRISFGFSTTDRNISIKLHLVGQKKELRACPRQGKKPHTMVRKMNLRNKQIVAAGQGSKHRAHGACTCTWLLLPAPPWGRNAGKTTRVLGNHGKKGCP